MSACAVTQAVTQRPLGTEKRNFQKISSGFEAEITARNTFFQKISFGNAKVTLMIAVFDRISQRRKVYVDMQHFASQRCYKCYGAKKLVFVECPVKARTV